MNLCRVITGLILAILFNLSSASPQVADPAVNVKQEDSINDENRNDDLLSQERSMGTVKSLADVKSWADIQALADYFPELKKQFSSARSFSERFGLSPENARYLDIFIVVNVVLILALWLWSLTPHYRICTWFDNCDSTVDQYPATVMGHNLQDPQVISYGRSLHKRSTQYIGPILRTLSEAIEKYEPSMKNKNQ